MSRSARWLATTLTLLLCACPKSDSSPPSDARATLSQAGGFYVRWKPSIEPPPLNEAFDGTLWLSTRVEGEPIELAQLDVDCRMPAHRHGMLQEVDIIEEGAGRYSVRGFLCHMAGNWVLQVDLTQGAITERAQFDILIE